MALASPPPAKDLAALPARELERLAVNINPGGWAVDGPLPMATLLGSCVAVCLFDPVRRVGGMNHFLLPTRRGTPGDDPDVVLAGDFAMEVLRNALVDQGARRDRLVAKAFGGGTIVSSIGQAIGARNATFAKEWLDREGIPLAAEDLQGPWARKVLFLPQHGDAWCRRLPVSQPAALDTLRQEKDYEEGLTRPGSRRAELF